MTTSVYGADIGLGDIMDFNDTITVTASMPSYEPLTSAETAYLIDFVNRIFIGQPLAIFGVGTNVINMIIFCKMGFKESINISLLGLAFFDLCSCITAFWIAFCFSCEFLKVDLPYRPTEVMYITGGGPHIICLTIIGVITTCIAFERCMCVSFPLKVKNIITFKRVLIFIISASIVVIGLYAPDYYVNKLDWKFYPSLNKTLLGLVYAKEKVEIEEVIFPIRGSLFSFATFFMTCICTGITIVVLKKNTKWRNKTTATSTSRPNKLSARDTKVATLMVFLTTVFIVCFTPYTITSIIMTVVPEFSLYGRYHNTFTANFSFLHIFESISSSTNIFVYYFRSSNYRETFVKMFPFMKSAKTASG